jgi:hypothetical protein
LHTNAVVVKMMVERPDVLFLNVMPGLNVTQEGEQYA